MSFILSLDRVPHYLCGHIFHPANPFPTDKTYTSLLLFYCYFHGIFDDELLSLNPFALTFAAKPRYTVYNRIKRPHYIRISLVKRDFHSESCFPRSVTLQNKDDFSITTFLTSHNLVLPFLHIIMKCAFYLQLIRLNLIL